MHVHSSSIHNIAYSSPYRAPLRGVLQGKDGGLVVIVIALVIVLGLHQGFAALQYNEAFLGVVHAVEILGVHVAVFEHYLVGGGGVEGVGGVCVRGRETNFVFDRMRKDNVSRMRVLTTLHILIVQK